MKKILLGMVMATMAGSVMAQAATDRKEFDMVSGDLAQTATSASSVATNWTYKVDDNRENRNFVKQDFDFSLSANVILAAAEDNVDGRWMTVGAVSVLGRNVYVGHSDGGSVAPCGDPLPAADAKVANAKVDAQGERFTPDTENGCTP